MLRPCWIFVLINERSITTCLKFRANRFQVTRHRYNYKVVTVASDKQTDSTNSPDKQIGGICLGDVKLKCEYSCEMIQIEERMVAS